MGLQVPIAGQSLCSVAVCGSPWPLWLVARLSQCSPPCTRLPQWGIAPTGQRGRWAPSAWTSGRAMASRLDLVGRPAPRASIPVPVKRTSGELFGLPVQLCAPVGLPSIEDRPPDKGPADGLHIQQEGEEVAEPDHAECDLVRPCHDPDTPKRKTKNQRGRQEPL
uniref:Uncharacterized protein n=1 Tax=Tetraselmis sp. GSL018 TaxID=582737 RepID=A0A061SL95_9CHLO